ncbi:hypothetical protein M0804_013886 [Polistes exclamans]|nr:hypothetical protein M0804_013886 [Polistes exclamans]
MRRVRSAPAAHHSKAKAFAHKTLHSCTHVFVRVGGSSGPLCQPYEGPFEVLERISDSVFRVSVNGKLSTISTERLKPAFFEAIEQMDTTPTMEGNNDSQSPISNQPKTVPSMSTNSFLLVVERIGNKKKKNVKGNSSRERLLVNVDILVKCHSSNLLDKFIAC